MVNQWTQIVDVKTVPPMPGLPEKPAGYVVQFGQGTVLWEDKGDDNSFGPMTQEDATALYTAMVHYLCKFL